MNANPNTEWQIPLPPSTGKLAEKNTHLGLMLDKFPASWNENENERKNKFSERVQLATLRKVAECSQSVPDNFNYDALRKRHSQLYSTAPSTNYASFRATTINALTMHLSRASALENAGICLHPVYGFPYLSGSGLKGMAHAYAVTVWLPSQPDERDAWRMIDDVFGWANTKERRERLKANPQLVRRRDDNDVKSPELRECTGSVIFPDAWPSQWPRLIVDIVNNHHTDYYSAKPDDNDHPPGDWENPIPIYFLAVEPQTEFEFAVSLSRIGQVANLSYDLSQHHLSLASQWLAGALCHLGAGAKTNAGYGAFQLAETRDEALKKSVSVVWEAAKTQKSRAEFTATLELVTPAFLAGADHKDPAGCDLRPATIRGQLRWWWRTMHSGHVDVATLRRMEAAIWGDSNSGGAVRVVLETVRRNGPTKFDFKDGFEPKTDFKKLHGLADRPNNKTTQGIFYLAYGMDEMSRGEKKPRLFLEAGSIWTVSLKARPSRFDLADGHSFVLESACLLEHAIASLWLLCAFGGVGSKGRKGFGSLQCDAPDFSGFSVRRCRQIADGFRGRLGVNAAYDRTRAESPALNDPQLVGPIEVSTPFTDAWQALDQIGFAYQGFAQSLAHKARKAALGLPRKIHGPRDDGPIKTKAGKLMQDPATWQPPVWLDTPQRDPRIEHENARYASPICIHLGRKNQTLSIQLIAFPSPSLPDAATSNTVLAAAVKAIRDRLTDNARTVTAVSRSQTSVHSSVRSGKRANGAPATVVILGSRTKGGYDVQETGKPKGVLNLGPVPTPPPETGASCSVFVHDDNATCPQYRWDNLREGKAPKKSPPRNKGWK